jgi:GNAT superfamily N-acetyltransferase
MATEEIHLIMDTISLRPLEPTDYAPIIRVIDEWWDGRAMHDMLPKLFFVHFRETSFIAESGGIRVGFLVGFISQTFPDQAYIHFVGVHPSFRWQGVGRRLYERFFEVAQAKHCSSVGCVTAPVNKNSIAFHLGLGFEMEAQPTVVNGVPIYQNYDGAGEDRVLFIKRLGGDTTLDSAG